MDTKSINEDFLLPDLCYGRRRVGHPSREDYYDYDNDINRIFPTAEYIDSINPEKQTKLRIAAHVSSLCWSMAGESVESQDESILDDYNW